MKTAPTIVVAGLLAGLFDTGALAQTAKSREEVRAEAASAAKAGQIDHGEVTTVPPVRSTKARTEVKAETRAAVKAGQIDHGEVTTTPPLPKTSKTRAEVKAEAASAIKGKELAPQPSRIREFTEKVAVSGLGSFITTAISLGLADLHHLL